ncbi:hypothetical protein D3C85_1232140 [compost metagenome]
MHLTDDAAHHFNRAGGAGHDPGTQTRQVELGALQLLQLGNEHGGHAVEHGSFLLRHSSKGGQRVKGITRVDHGGAVGYAAEVASHQTKAVVERHRDHHAVILGKAETLTNHVTIVEDIVVAERGTLGESRGA